MQCFTFRNVIAAVKRAWWPPSHRLGRSFRLLCTTISVGQAKADILNGRRQASAMSLPCIIMDWSAGNFLRMGRNRSLVNV